MAWNTYNHELMGHLVKWAAGKKAAIVVVPADFEPWLIAGDIAEYLTEHPTGGMASSSSTMGAEDIAIADTNIYFFVMPEAEDEPA